jgi:hypothetical protein
MISEGAILLFSDWNANRASPDCGSRKAWGDVLEKFDVVIVMKAHIAGVEKDLLSIPTPKENRRPPRNGDVYSTTPKSKDEPINTWRYDGKNWVNQANNNPASNQRVTQLITTWWSIKNFGYQ